ncbi:MAG: phasin family protein [Hyphomicrobium sp.]
MTGYSGQCTLGDQMGQMFKLDGLVKAMMPAAAANLKEMYFPALTNAATFGGAVCEGYSRFGAEWFAFLGRRVGRQVEFTSALAGCRTPIEIAQAWRTFNANAIQDYGDELSKLTEVGKCIYQSAAPKVTVEPKLQEIIYENIEASS